MNIQNLKALQILLAGIEQKYFNMKYFREMEGDLNPVCGSVGCAVGYATALDPEGFSKMRDEYITEAKECNNMLFIDWSTKFFEVEMDQWDFLFHGAWCLGDNSPSGAIKRIDWLIANDGVTPDTDLVWNMQQGTEKLIY